MIYSVYHDPMTLPATGITGTVKGQILSQWKKDAAYTSENMRNKMMKMSHFCDGGGGGRGPDVTPAVLEVRLQPVQRWNLWMADMCCSK